MNRAILVAVAAWGCLGAESARAGAPATSTTAARQSQDAPTRPGAPAVPRVMEAFRVPPGVDMRIDGHLDEAVWEQAPSYADWVQKEPVEGAPARNDTRVWLLYDQDALYVGAILHDEDPASIARNMARRDAAYAGRSDYFEVMLDPNNDRRTGYRFRVTAGGVQTDRYLYADDQEDAAWDAVYETAVEVDGRGWVVEMRIPLSQIRYETAEGPQTWGINWGRRRAADNELTRFSLVSRLRPGRVSQFGRVTGLRLSGSPRRLELLPYAVSQAHRGPAEDGNPFFDGSELDTRLGLDLSYGLGSAFTLDATVNPDFGQVEADPAVVNLSAFETLFEERRPFFVEDARIFDFSRGASRLFYSRRIGRSPHGSAPEEAEFSDVPDAATILGAAKLTGRTTRGLSLGALLAVTEAEEGRAWFGEDGEVRTFPAEPRSTYGVVSVRQDFRGGESTVGGTATGLVRSLPGDGSFDWLPSSAWSAGVDFDHSWSDRTWGLFGILAVSHVRGGPGAMLRIQRASNHYRQRPDLEWSRLDPAASSLTGAEWRLQFERRAGNWTGALWAAQVTSGFEVNDLGFATVPERLDGGARIGYQDVAPGRWFRDYRVSASLFRNWSHELLEHSLSLDRIDWARTRGANRLSAGATLHNFWTLNASLSHRPETMSRDATRGGPRMVEPATIGFGAGVGTDNRELLSVNAGIDVTRGRRGVGDDLEVSVAATLQPSTRLLVTLEPSWRRESVGAQYVTTSEAVPYAPTYGSRYLFADLERRTASMTGRVDWTFTPTLSLQVFAQPLLSSGDYVRYKQLRAPETFAFEAFEEGSFVEAGGGMAGCVGGRTCVDTAAVRSVDFDGDGVGDASFRDRDFNLRSLRSTAVLRWEYRPGSALFLVWQHRQSETADVGDFDLGRDADALRGAPSDDVFIVKANVWLSW